MKNIRLMTNKEFTKWLRPSSHVQALVRAMMKAELKARKTKREVR
jgi:hypothetical protein